MLLSASPSKIGIGSILDMVGPPDSKWKKCNGEILVQSDYPLYVNKSVDLHPLNWEAWETITVPTFALAAISKMGNIIVATPTTGQKVFYSTDNGDTWQESGNVLPSAGNWLKITNNGTYFVALRNGSNAAAYSSNGTSWTGFTMPASGSWNFLGWNGSIFLAFLGGTNATLYYSSTGTSFTAGASFGVGVYCNAVCKGYDSNNNFLFYDSNYNFRKTNNGTSLSTSANPFIFSQNDPSPSKFIRLNGQWWTGCNNSYLWFAVSTDDTPTLEYRPFLGQHRYDEYLYVWDGSFYSGEEIVFLDYQEYHTWVTKNGHDFSARVNLGYTNYDSIFLSKSLGAIVLCGSNIAGSSRLMRLKYTDYDYMTHFQLPRLHSNIPGMSKYIKVK